MSHQKGEAYMNENIKQSVTMTPKMCEEIEKYSLNHHISKSQAIRALLEKALTQDTLVGEQDIIRRYIRDELEVVISKETLIKCTRKAKIWYNRNKKKSRTGEKNETDNIQRYGIR